MMRGYPAGGCVTRSDFDALVSDPANCAAAITELLTLRYNDARRTAMGFATYDDLLAYLVDATDDLDIMLTSPHAAKTYRAKGQLHCHTTNSDGGDSPETVGNAYKAAGFDFYAIADHDYVTPDPEVSGIIFLDGGKENGDYGTLISVHNCEWTSLPGGLSHPAYTVYLNHRLPYQFPGLLEVYNYACALYPSDTYWDTYLSRGGTVYGIAVDDTHNVGLACGLGYILVDVDTISKANILAEITAGNFYASSGNDLLVSVNGRTITATSSGASDIEFIGFGGASLLTKEAVTAASYTAIGSEGYIRVKSTKNSDNTIAWGQPIRVVLT